MRKKPAAPEPAPVQRSGPPPLRAQPAPKVEKKKRFHLRDLARVFRGFSIGRLRNDLGHFLIFGLILFVIIFGISGAFFFGGAPDTPDEAAGGEQFPVIARINGGEELTRAKLDEVLAAYNLNRGDAVAYRHTQIGQIYDTWVSEQLWRLEARKRGVKVTDADVDAKIDEQVQQRIEAEKGDMPDRKWRYRLQQRGLTPETLADSYRAEHAEARDDLRQMLLLEKVTEAIKDEAKLSDDDLRAQYEEVEPRIILVRTNARKPMPPVPGVTETDDDKANRAEQEKQWQADLELRKADAEKLLTEVKAKPASFEAIARAKSDDYTKENGGLVQQANRDGLKRFGEAFAEAVFKLKTGEISGLIAGDEGWVIARVEKRKTWPDDFQKPEPRGYDQAKTVIDTLFKQATAAGADFAALAKAHSEDEGSKANGGEYPLTGRGMWVKPFEKIAFGLEVNEVSPPFRTAFGWHIIQCLERKLYDKGETPPEDPKLPEGEEDPDAEFIATLPKLKNPDVKPAEEVRVRHILIKAEDPERKIKDLREQAETTKQNEHLQKFQEELEKQAYASGVIEVEDPQIKAYLAKKENDREGEWYWLQRAVHAWPESHPEVHFEYAQLLQQSSAMGTDTQPQVAAAKALGQAGGPEAVKALLEALNTFFPDVKKAAVEALGQIGDKSVVSRLQQLHQTEPDAEVKKAIEAALGKLGASVGGGPAEAPTAPAAPPAPANP